MINRNKMFRIVTLLTFLQMKMSDRPNYFLSPLDEEVHLTKFITKL